MGHDKSQSHKFNQWGGVKANKYHRFCVRDTPFCGNDDIKQAERGISTSLRNAPWTFSGRKMTEVYMNSSF